MEEAANKDKKKVVERERGTSELVRLLYAIPVQKIGLIRRQVTCTGTGAGAQDQDVTGAWPSRRAIQLSLTPGTLYPFFVFQLGMREVYV